MISAEDRILAGEFALGVLPKAERERFAQRMAGDRELAAAAREWDEALIPYADEIAPEEPPRALLQKLEQRLFSGAAKPSLWSNLNFWRGLAVASVAGLVALGAWNLQPKQVEPTFVAQVQGTSGLQLAAFFNEETGELRLNRTEGMAADGRSLELWLIAGKDAPVSLGVLSAQNADKIIVPGPLRGKFKDGVLAVSDEPVGGSPTGAPTGAVLATGKLTVI